MRLARAAAAAILAAVLSALVGVSNTADAHAATQPVDRVLVISLPAVSWGDVTSADAPRLKALLARSAVADLVTRAAGRRNSVASGYATLGAGGRASAVNPLAAQAFEPSEPYGLTSAGDVFRQRAPSFPLCGIAGIDASNAGEAVGAGADGVAVISALSLQADPQAAARALRAVVDAALAQRKRR